MASDDEEVVLTFTVKGDQVAVRQIRNVDKATAKLDTTTKKAAKESGDAWERYASSAGSSLAKLAKTVGASELVVGGMVTSVATGLTAAVAAYKTGSVGLAGAAALAGRTAAKRFRDELVDGPGGARGTLTLLRTVLAGGGLSALASSGLIAGGGLVSSMGSGAASGIAGAGLVGLGKTVGKIGIGGTAAIAGGVGLAAYGTKKLLDWGAGGMQGASDQIEYANRVNSLLGRGAAEAQLGRADSAATMGLSRTQYLNSFGGLTAQLQGSGIEKQAAGTMAAKLVKGAADLGSFNNMSTDQVAEALQSGLRGEMDPLERAGVYLNQAAIDVQAEKMFGKKTVQLGVGEQMQARLAAIQGSTGWAQASGDFERSLPTSLEGQRRVRDAKLADAQEKLGAGLNKLVSALMPLADPLINALNSMVDLLVPALNTIASLLKPIIELLSNILGMGDRFKEITDPESYTAPGTNGGAMRSTEKILKELPGMGAEGKWAGASWGALTPWGQQYFGAGSGMGTRPSAEATMLDIFSTGKAAGGMVPGWSPGIDNMLVPLSGGEGVLVPETVAMLGGAGAIDQLNLAGRRRRGASSRQGYANGVGAAQQTAAMLGGGDKYRQLGRISGIFQVGSPAGTAAGSPGAPTDISAIPQTGVVPEAQFLALASRALAEKGLPVSYAYDILQQAKHESSLRPDAINNTDSNAQAGHPSQGILQFIPSTFAEYAQPGYTNFLGVEDQIRALINYVPARYGSMDYLKQNGYSAYDAGGWLPPGTAQTVNQTNEPEAVLTADQWKDVKSLAGVGSGGAGVTVSIGTIVIDATAGGGNLASVVVDKLGDAIAQRINRANDRRL